MANVKRRVKERVMPKHLNNGKCAKCAEIIQRYPGLNEFLLSWFKGMQAKFPELHLSCAGRGKVDQEAAFQRGASKAHYLESSHNFNCAIDIFQLKDGNALWNKEWFNTVVAPSLPSNLNWYGKPFSPFYELPHLELLNWKFLRDNGTLVPVE